MRTLPLLINIDLLTDMHAKMNTAVLLSFLSVVFSVPFKTHVPKDWTLTSEILSKNQILKVSIALKPLDASKLEKSLLEIASPKSPRFRKYLKQQEIADLVGRPSEDIERVSEWVRSVDGAVSQVPPHRDWIIASLPVASIENAFECQLGVFHHEATNRRTIAAKDSYNIPEQLRDIIDLISGLNTFPAARWSSVRMSSNPNAGDSVPASITPETIYDSYQVDSSGSHGSKLGSQAVIEFGQLANINGDDLQTFFKQFQKDLKGETCGVVYGTNNFKIRGSVEANLDAQYIMATGVFVNTSTYKITSTYSGESIEDEFLEYTLIVNSQIEPPLVHSISYGEYGGSYDNATDQRFSYELQKMGISGISVLLASGDNGVGCDKTGSSQEFDYPSSPYITMVGATYLDAKTKLEVGATLSSGGFSKDFMQAEWQADAVNAYFASGVPLPDEDYYKEGRAYPDVAAFGQNVQVVSAGEAISVAGTSCSAPIFAGVIASINHELLSKGKSPLGFLNPWLYANPQMFYDVLTGSNPYEKCEGFQAAAGWDPVTGMGTPLYHEMLTAAFA